MEKSEAQTFLETFEPSADNFNTLERVLKKNAYTPDVEKLFSGDVPEDWYYLAFEGGSFGFCGWKFELLHQHGGEGQGDDFYIVFSIEKDGAPHSIWKIPGYHASHDGSYLHPHRAFKVKPRERTITEYVKE